MRDDDLDLLAELEDPTPEQERIAAVLADLEQVAHRPDVPQLRTHFPGCWTDRRHGDCLAARIRATLTGEDHPHA